MSPLAVGLTDYNLQQHTHLDPSDYLQDLRKLENIVWNYVLSSVVEKKILRLRILYSLSKNSISAYFVGKKEKTKQKCIKNEYRMRRGIREDNFYCRICLYILQSHHVIQLDSTLALKTQFKNSNKFPTF